MAEAHTYEAPLWLPGGHIQTIWSALWAGHGLSAPARFHRERWNTPDGDFIDLDFSGSGIRDGSEPAAATLMVLFHGLEGSSSSHYAQAFYGCALAAGMGFVVPHFRGCSGEINLAPRAYHSGDYEEVDWILKRLATQWRERGGRDLIAVGVSLGGNALLRWAGEAGDSAGATVSAVASLCSPLDLTAGGHAIGRGFNRQVYTRVFLRSMKPRALAKLRQFPKLFDGQAMLAARDLYQFDNAFTAPLHGFRDVDDYWLRASAKPHLDRVRLPALLVNARNDPFIPAWSLPTSSQVGNFVQLWQPQQGGHVGFPVGRPPGHVRQMPAAITSWLDSQLSS